MEEIHFPFVDVSKRDWFYEAVKSAKAEGITSCVEETHFALCNPYTRVHEACS